MVTTLSLPLSQSGHVRVSIPSLCVGWRPFLHVDDAARAVVMVCEQSATTPPKEIYNVGANDQNFQKVSPSPCLSDP
jgi:nucleoside-diphosphate-sugar epimerase